MTKIADTFYFAKVVLAAKKLRDEGKLEEMNLEPYCYGDRLNDIAVRCEEMARTILNVDIDEVIENTLIAEFGMKTYTVILTRYSSSSISVDVRAHDRTEAISMVEDADDHGEYEEQWADEYPQTYDCQTTCEEV